MSADHLQIAAGFDADLSAVRRFRSYTFLPSSKSHTIAISQPQFELDCVICTVESKQKSAACKRVLCVCVRSEHTRACVFASQADE